MILTSTIKVLLILSLCLTSTVFSQNIDNINEETQDNSKLKETFKTAIITYGVHKPYTTDKSYIGRGTKGDIGFKLGAQLFIYKHFFIGTFFNATLIDVTDSSLTGDYDRSQITSAYLEVGYEFSILENFNLGLCVAPIGYANYRNDIRDGRVRQQNDHAYISIYQTYLSYNFAGNFSVFIDYSFRNDKTKINTASEIQSEFDTIQYHNIGLGLKFSIGKTVIIN
ncbi:hypothetical protein [Winogradskyella forsetii]|uniref:hypothetical protein n=1 Tax=Winogradskyella forsetii TaxID=2686077 RepID=UPI0015B99D6E|nr:hypothetical protein [Winogradskyella forsetii]